MLYAHSDFLPNIADKVACVPFLPSVLDLVCSNIVYHSGDLWVSLSWHSLRAFRADSIVVVSPARHFSPVSTYADVVVRWADIWGTFLIVAWVVPASWKP